MLTSGTATLTPSARLRALDGSRVRMRGFMATMDDPPRRSFVFTPRPVHCDEAGGGTADLPPSAIRVVVPSASGHRVPHVPGLVEVVGRLSLGRQVDEQGRTHFLQITLDPQPATGPTRPSGAGNLQLIRKGDVR